MVNWLHRLFSSPNAKPAKVEVALPAEAAVPPAAAPVTPQPVPSMPASGISWKQRDDLNANFTDWLFEGNAYSDLFTNQLEKEILAMLEKTVKSEQSGADLVRRMPGVIPQLLNSLRTEFFSGKQLAKKISHDVVLVAAVVRLANSSSYTDESSITSIEHAVLVLGQSGLRQLITSVAFRPIIDLKSGHFTKLIAPRIWDQSEKCAIAGRLLAQDEEVDPFEVFLAGLIQHVGLIVSLRVMDQMADDGQALGSASFFNSLIGYGRILSCSIAREWHFPDAVINAIEEQGSNYNAAKMSPVGRILSMGDYLSKMHILVSHDRMHAADARFTKGLSDKAIHCLRQLDEMDASE